MLNINAALSMILFRPCFIFIFWLSVVGCVPMVHTFYEPSSEIGKVEQQYCHGQVGPRNIIRLQANESKIEIYTQEKEKHNLLLHISVKIPPEIVLRFKSRDFKLTVEGQSTDIRPSRLDRSNHPSLRSQRS